MAAILDHLKHVAVKADMNKMPVQNLAVCFGPVLLCPSISPTAADAEVADNFKKHTEVLAYLLDIWPENRGNNDLRDSFLIVWEYILIVNDTPTLRWVFNNNNALLEWNWPLICLNN